MVGDEPSELVEDGEKLVVEIASDVDWLEPIVKTRLLELIVEVAEWLGIAVGDGWLNIEATLLPLVLPVELSVNAMLPVELLDRSWRDDSLQLDVATILLDVSIKLVEAVELLVQNEAELVEVLETELSVLNGAPCAEEIVALARLLTCCVAREPEELRPGRVAEELKSEEVVRPDEGLIPAELALLNTEETNVLDATVPELELNQLDEAVCAIEEAATAMELNVVRTTLEVGLDTNNMPDEDVLLQAK